jgi:hypothetical protein
MTREPESDLKERARRDLARLREAVTGKRHWVYLTDDPAAALALRRSAAGALFVAALVCITATGDVFPCAALAVPKKLWPPSEARRVAAAAAAGRAKVPDAGVLRGGADLLPISRRPERIAIFLQQLLDGTVTADPPACPGPFRSPRPDQEKPDGAN